MGDHPESAQRGGRQVQAIVALLVYAAIASALPQRSASATVAVLIAAAIVVAAATRQHPDANPTGSTAVQRATWLWSGLLVAGLLWEAWAFFHQPAWDIASESHPTLSSLVDPYLDQQGVRYVAWTAWLYAGWRLARP